MATWPGERVDRVEGLPAETRAVVRTVRWRVMVFPLSMNGSGREGSTLRRHLGRFTAVVGSTIDANLSDDELEVYRRLASIFFEADTAMLTRLIAAGELKEVECDDQEAT